MKKTARTAWVSLAEGWTMPYFLATSIFRSAMSGKLTSTFSISRNLIFSLIVRSQAMWLKLLSMERPISSQLSALNSSAIDANVMNSVVHTGVKSAGWLNRMTHLPL